MLPMDYDIRDDLHLRNGCASDSCHLRYVLRKSISVAICNGWISSVELFSITMRNMTLQS